MTNSKNHIIIRLEEIDVETDKLELIELAKVISNNKIEDYSFIVERMAWV